MTQFGAENGAEEAKIPFHNPHTILAYGEAETFTAYLRAWGKINYFNIHPRLATHFHYPFS